MRDGMSLEMGLIIKIDKDIRSGLENDQRRDEPDDAEEPGEMTGDRWGQEWGQYYLSLGTDGDKSGDSTHVPNGANQQDLGTVGHTPL